MKHYEFNEQQVREIRAFQEPFEGRFDHMYLDTVGLVTVGIGCMIPSAAAAREIPFMSLGLARPADPEVVAADWARVKSAPPKMLAKRYAPYTSVRLTDKAIDDLHAKAVSIHVGILAANVHGFADMPWPVQKALFELEFSMGWQRLTGFVKMFAAINAGDYVTAAAESGRTTVKPERNEAVASWFRSAGVRA